LEKTYTVCRPEEGRAACQTGKRVKLFKVEKKRRGGLRTVLLPDCRPAAMKKKAKRRKGRSGKPNPSMEPRGLFFFCRALGQRGWKGRKRGKESGREGGLHEEGKKRLVEGGEVGNGCSYSCFQSRGRGSGRKAENRTLVDRWEALVEEGAERSIRSAVADNGRARCVADGGVLNKRQRIAAERRGRPKIKRRKEKKIKIRWNKYPQLQPALGSSSAV